MCITINHAELSKTKILSLCLESGNRFIAYSNSVKNLSGKPNAMILPIPGETKPEWFHNTESYKEFMDEIIEKSDFTKGYLGIRMRSASKGISLGFEKFQLGMYNVGLSNSFEGLQEFIKELPEEKRPEISEELQQFFKEKYAGWSFAICTFDSEKAIDAQPIAFEYQPFSKDDLLYFPTMDGHDGKAPDMDSNVDTDHTFIFEHTGSKVENMLNNKPYVYVQEVIKLSDKVPGFLQNKPYRTVFVGKELKNADTYIDRAEFEKITFSNMPELKRMYWQPKETITN